MKKGKHVKKISGRKVAFALALVLVLSGIIGGTLAWLTDTTDPVKNTFTVGNINIDLTESPDLDLKMVPGKTLTKDPEVTVKADSEACWLFVEVQESDNFNNFLAYTMADGWTALSGVTGVYYREVAATTADLPFAVIKEDKVTVKDAVTKAQLDALTADTYPTLTFTAYAVQKEGVSTASAAWAIAKPTT